MPAGCGRCRLVSTTVATATAVPEPPSRRRRRRCCCQSLAPPSRPRLRLLPSRNSNFTNDFPALRQTSAVPTGRQPATGPAATHISVSSPLSIRTLAAWRSADVMAITATWRRKRQLAGRSDGDGSAVRPAREGGWPSMAPLAVISSVLAFLLYYNTLDAEFAYDDRWVLSTLPAAVLLSSRRN